MTTPEAEDQPPPAKRAKIAELANRRRQFTHKSGQLIYCYLDGHEGDAKTAAYLHYLRNNVVNSLDKSALLRIPKDAFQNVIYFLDTEKRKYYDLRHTVFGMWSPNTLYYQMKRIMTFSEMFLNLYELICNKAERHLQHLQRVYTFPYFGESVIIPPFPVEIEYYNCFKAEYGDASEDFRVHISERRPIAYYGSQYHFRDNMYWTKRKAASLGPWFKSRTYPHPPDKSGDPPMWRNKDHQLIHKGKYWYLYEPALTLKPPPQLGKP